MLVESSYSIISIQYYNIPILFHILLFSLSETNIIIALLASSFYSMKAILYQPYSFGYALIFPSDNPSYLILLYPYYIGNAMRI